MFFGRRAVTEALVRQHQGPMIHSASSISRWHAHIIASCLAACGGTDPRPAGDTGDTVGDTMSDDDASTTMLSAGTSTVTSPSSNTEGDDATTSSTSAEDTSESGSETTGGRVGCEGDFIAAWLEEHPLAPGEWSSAIDGMQGLNAFHDPNARTGQLRFNNRPIVDDVISFSGPHPFEVGDEVLLLNSPLSGEVHTVMAISETTITIDGSVDAPSETNVILFPDYYTRTIPFEDEAGGHMLDWNAQFYYDALTGMHTIGGGVGSSSSYDDSQYKTWRIRYDPCENRWYKVWNPLGYGSGHHYGSNAMDPAGRRYFRGATAFDLDDDTAEGWPIPDTPDDNGTANTVVYHEGLSRLYRITSHGRVRYWEDDAGWSELEMFEGLNNHPISAYLSAAETVVFGGGNAPANGFYKIDPEGAITRLDDVPQELSPFHAVTRMILDAGFSDRLVILTDGYEAGVGNPTPEVWWLKPNADSGEQWEMSPDVITPELASYGGVKREAGATALRHLGVIMVFRYWASGELDAADPASRRAAVWLYRPSER